MHKLFVSDRMQHIMRKTRNLYSWIKLVYLYYYTIWYCTVYVKQRYHNNINSILSQSFYIFLREQLFQRDIIQPPMLQFMQRQPAINISTTLITSYSKYHLYFNSRSYRSAWLINYYYVFEMISVGFFPIAWHKLSSIAVLPL